MFVSWTITVPVAVWSQHFCRLKLLPTVLACLFSYRNHWSANSTETPSLHRPWVAQHAFVSSLVSPSSDPKDSVSIQYLMKAEETAPQCRSQVDSFHSFTFNHPFPLAAAFLLFSCFSVFCFIYLNVFCSYPFNVRALLYMWKHWLPMSLHHQLSC